MFIKVISSCAYLNRRFSLTSPWSDHPLSYTTSPPLTGLLTWLAGSLLPWFWLVHFSLKQSFSSVLKEHVFLHASLTVPQTHLDLRFPFCFAPATSHMLLLQKSASLTQTREGLTLSGLSLPHHILISVCVCACVCVRDYVHCTGFLQIFFISVWNLQKKGQLKPWDRSRTMLSCDWRCSRLTLDERFSIPSFWLRRRTFTWTGWHPGVMFVMTALCHVGHQVVPTDTDSTQPLLVGDENYTPILPPHLDQTHLLLNDLLLFEYNHDKSCFLYQVHKLKRAPTPRNAVLFCLCNGFY